jgi:site-specific recombinase XerD
MKPSITLSEATALYLKALETAGKSKRTLYTYNKDLEQIQAFLGQSVLFKAPHYL